jgi:mono/diheme cytochrome c family protein
MRIQRQVGMRVMYPQMKSQAHCLSIVALAVLLVLLALVSACYPNPQPAGLTPIPTLAPAQQVTLVPVLQRPVQPTAVAPPGGPQASDAAQGAAIYSLHCPACHGAQGEGVDAPPLRDSQYVQTASAQQLYSTVADGRTGTEMPGWLEVNGGPLMQADIVRVIAFLHTLQGVSSLPTATPGPEEPAEPTPIPGGPTPEPAQPSMPGGPGPAASLAGDVERGRSHFGAFCAACHSADGVGGVPNPGSDDGTVPELNPIDPTLVSADPKVFAVNVDLFIEHGSVPEGPAPMVVMPSFGDGKMLTDQEIADLIAYVISLNTAVEPQ